MIDSSNTNFSTLVDLLCYRALHQPNKLAFTFLQNGEMESASLTYQELDRQAQIIAAYLQSFECVGERALLLYPPGLEFIAAFFGCLYAGVIAVPAYPPKRNQKMSRLEAIVLDSQATVSLTTKEQLTTIENRFLDNPLLANLHWLTTDNIVCKQEVAWHKPAVNSETLTFLQYTSGSTGTPKGVMVSHRNLLHNLEYMKQAFELTQDSVSVTWLPSFHDMGLIDGIIQPIYTGFLGVLMPPAFFIQQPFRWLQAISHYKATHCGSPNFGYELCVKYITQEQQSTLDLSSWCNAYSGAEPIRKETLERFADTFKSSGFRANFLYPCYGMAESTLMISGGEVEDEPIICTVEADALEQNKVVKTSCDNHNVRHLVGCGHLWLDTKIVIADPELLTQCPANQVGEIWVSGLSVAQGYWNRPEQTEQSFQAYLADTGQGPFLRTGDLGFLLDGELFITGRLKDMIIILGRNHYPQDIELTVVQSHPALRIDCGVAFSVDMDGQEKLVIVQEVERSYLRKLNASEVIGAIRQAVVQQHDIEVYAVLLLKTASLPKTSSGKVQRSACRAGFLAGSLDVVVDWCAHPQNKTNFRHLETEIKSLLQQVQTATLPASSSEIQNSHEASVTQYKSCSQEAIAAWLISKVSEQLEVVSDSIDIQQPLAEYGLGSLAVVRLSGELQQWLGYDLSPSIFYDYPSIKALSQHLGMEATTSNLKTSDIANLKADFGKTETQNEAIAVIGIGCRFPGANSPENFWQILHDGVDVIQKVPSSRWDINVFYDSTPANPGKMNTRYGGFLEQVDHFDPQFFGISAREAETMDPQQRLLLEVSWEALENAGQIPEQLAGSKTGVFIGISNSDYSRLLFNHPAGTEAYYGTGNALSIAANRLSYLLDLRGPSWAVDTACSSSLVAVHQACQSLRQGDSQLALAGGVNLILAPQLTISFSQTGMMAADGRCKTFDSSADGYVRGEGCGVVVLKRLCDALRDGDNILALIKGSAVNQDGRSNGLTAPNGISQQEVIWQALKNANVQPAQISYVEAHGTGTSLGDPIEVNSLKEVLMVGRTSEQPCWIGSVKTNIGHLEAAAGIAGLIKVILSLQHEEIPPHLHFKKLNPYIGLADTPLSIPLKLQKWSKQDHQQLASVSSFGFGGTNAHIILEAAPTKDRVKIEVERPIHLMTLSAKSENALRELVQRYETFLESNLDAAIADVCFTANIGRSHFKHRLAIAAESTVQLLAALKETESLFNSEDNTNKRAKIAFLFTGQGSQYINMGRELYDTQPTFRKNLELCDEILRPYLKKPLLSVLYPAPNENSPLNETGYTQPALFALEYALFQLWKSWGIVPDIVMGHSLGEYVAACVAGVFSLEDGLKLIAERARLMQDLPSNGQMVVVFASESEVAAVIDNYRQTVAIAAINGSNSVVISGMDEIIETVVAELNIKGIQSRPLHVSHAFHSPLIEPMLPAFEQVAKSITYSNPKIQFISNLTGEKAQAEIACPEYWCRHLLEPVKFLAGMESLDRENYDFFIEIGPKPILVSMGCQCLPQENTSTWLPSLRQGKSDWQVLLQSLRELYMQKVPVDWSGFDQDYLRSRIQLPTYPFQRQRYWIKDIQAGINQGNNKNLHPLVHKQIQLAESKQILFETHLSHNSALFLKHYRIFETTTLPVSAYLEMVLAAGAKVFHSDNLLLKSVLIHQVLNLPDDELQTVQLVLHPQGLESADFKIFSLIKNVDTEEVSWTLHASGQVLVHESIETPQINLPTLQADYTQQVCTQEHDHKLQERGIICGFNFQVIETLWKCQEKALGKIQLPEELTYEVNEYKLYPILIDAGLQMLIGTLADNSQQDIHLKSVLNNYLSESDRSSFNLSEGISLPETLKEVYIIVSLESCRFYGYAGQPLWGQVTFEIEDSYEVDAETIFGNFQLFDQSGKIIAEIVKAKIKRVLSRVFPGKETNLQLASSHRQRMSSLSKAKLLTALPEERQPMLENYLLQELAKSLRQPLANFNPEQYLDSLLDSLMAFEIKNRIETDLEIVLPISQFFANRNIRQLAVQLLEKFLLQSIFVSNPVSSTNNNYEEITL
ncbi:MULTISPECIES: polyketide synthase [unclassified Nostoc]|uniref:polyketide synthase n=1 Tax=unclassified Nostoc TaxID=2593658 RepID=UPI002AD20799|nr:polyketide synthase [Nostoc sp. DedQUE03]MDZ7975149.1 beta-ketoacyl synthase N-terminal-like domain-containing protein [Nostoc sp. DedQUE03]MDZ8045669.1 beta-ketoacyl synthase N-terminal-like domain-containing protein [Nostoc sp. DedQUE02]